MKEINDSGNSWRQFDIEMGNSLSGVAGEFINIPISTY